MAAVRAARLLLAAGLALQIMAAPAQAENAMGYRMMTQKEAAALPQRHGSLGLDVDRGQRIDDSGLSFDIMRVRSVRSGSAAAAAGLRQGDQIIAVDGRVFPSIATFAAYLGSIEPGSRIDVDYMPAGAGPQQAQRIALNMGPSGRNAPAPQERSGLSTGQKLAIGAGAVALFGCYEMGCFSRRSGNGQPVTQRP